MDKINPQLIQSAGWLSPDGLFFPCNIYEHDELAIKLSQQFYDNNLDGTKLLESKNWIHVTAQGELLGSINKLTQNQIDTIFDLIIHTCANINNNYCSNLRLYLKHILK